MSVMYKKTKYGHKKTISLQVEEIEELLRSKFDQLIISCAETGNVLRTLEKAEFRQLLESCKQVPLKGEDGKFSMMSNYYIASYNF